MRVLILVAARSQDIGSGDTRETTAALGVRSAENIRDAACRGVARRIGERGMRARRVAIAVMMTLAWAAGAAAVGAGESAPRPILPQELRWMRPPGNADVQGAWVLGAEGAAGPYLFRVRLAAGGKVAPHVHPDERSSTVLAGTLYVGFGSAFDETKLVAIPAGAVYVAPANVPHYVFAKDGAVEYQESGVGPTKTVPVP